MPLKVLIVEDNPTARITLEKILSLRGFHVQSAGTLQRGMELFDGQAAVILDLDLPDGCGVELLKKIRTENRATKVLVVSACEDPIVLREVRLLRPDGLFCKPLDVLKVLEQLRCPS